MFSSLVTQVTSPSHGNRFSKANGEADRNGLDNGCSLTTDVTIDDDSDFGGDGVCGEAESRSTAGDVGSPPTAAGGKAAVKADVVLCFCSSIISHLAFISSDSSAAALRFVSLCTAACFFHVRSCSIVANSRKVFSIRKLCCSSACVAIFASACCNRSSHVHSFSIRNDCCATISASASCNWSSYVCSFSMNKKVSISTRAAMNEQV